MFLNYVALGFLIFGILVVFYLIIAIHDIPYEIAKKRDHPHQDAIHVAGWVSLFTLHVIWPFLWIWATIYRPERGYGFGSGNEQMSAVNACIVDLERRMAKLEGKPPGEVEHLENRMETLEGTALSQIQTLESRLAALESRPTVQED